LTLNFLDLDFVLLTCVFILIIDLDNFFYFNKMYQFLNKNCKLRRQNEEYSIFAYLRVLLFIFITRFYRNKNNVINTLVQNKSMILMPNIII
jgi:hypothetical protein